MRKFWQLQSAVSYTAVVAALSLAACVNNADQGNSGGGAAGTTDTATAFDTAAGTGKDAAAAGTDAASAGADADAAKAGEDTAKTGDDTATATDNGSTGGDTGSATDDSSGSTDQDSGTTGGDTGTTGGDTAAGGCKKDDDCPASTIACKKATCNTDTGVCGTADLADGTDCDDGNACTTGDKCAKGLCGAGAAKDCDDKNVCTDDSCDPAAGCKNANTTQQCNDGDECTTADACKDGKCTGGPAKTCDDGNPCTDDKCDSAKGCQTSDNTADCSDGDACTTGEKCAAGTCGSATPTVCDDKNACTKDTCDPKTGCKNDPLADASNCDDGDACTQADACTGGKCAGTALNCDDKNACTKDTCDKAAGCAHANDDTAACDDGNSCTTGDKCTAGACTGTGKDCNDNNPCTDDSCKDNVCTNANNAAACDDGDKCTQGDTCDAGKCTKNTAVNCDDNNVCTTDTCDKASGTCGHANNTAACDDKSACTSGDVCKDGACVGGTAKNCDDGKPCTADACDDASGTCKSTNISDGTVCDDGTVCTQNDACTAGACAGKAITCDDGNPCTDDKCDAKTGCTTANNTAACEDGDACTKPDACKDGKCVAGAKDTCDDKNACTNDTCDPKAGCVHTNNTATCTDGDACTDADACKDGVCAGQPKKCNDSNLCTDDTCDKATGCKYANNTAICDDGSVCTSGDKCAAGKCVGGAALTCNDNNVCTTDTCDAKLGCQFAPGKDGTACDDGNGCTTGDKCTTGKCLGAGKSCDDNNVCTNDGCANNVCTNTNNKNPCNDGTICTLVDVCDGAGKCVGGTPLPCNDQNPCTTDTCDAVKGCVFTNNTAPCDDGLYCTTKDTCALGLCKSATPTCNDGNVCTNDLCDEAGKKCATVNNTADCDDGDKCTPGTDKCAAGKCVPSAPKDCDDGNPCTIESCDKLTGVCGHKLTTDATVCAPIGLPALWPVDYADPLFFGKSNSTTVKWQTDATAANPGKLTGAASLNFNNGTDYNDPNAQGPVNKGQVVGTATGKFYVDATKVTSAYMTMSFYSYNGVENVDNYDERWVEFSTDGFVTLAGSTRLDNPKNNGAWALETIDLKALIGKSFQYRFRFDSKDGVNNTGKGWFVDQINIYLGPVATISPTTPLLYDTFDTNANGWQFSAAVAGSQWAVDATPAVPPPSPGAANANSLNFNNGKDFAGITSGSTLAPVVNLEGVTAGPVTLMWKEWIDTEAYPTADLRYVEVTGDAFVTMPVKTQFNTTNAMLGGWRWAWIDLSSLKGKKLHVRFRFDAVDNISNGGKGWFVDDMQLSIYQAPSFADMVNCANAANWTFANGAGPGWAVDTVGDVPAYSPDCSLNFNNNKANASGKFDYTCANNATKANGTATSPVFTVQAPPAGQKAWLAFKAYADIESLDGYDKLSVVVYDVAAKTNAEIPVGKAAILKKWGDVAIDLSAFAGKQITIAFKFDSVDCQTNGTAGVFIDDVQVRAK